MHRDRLEALAQTADAAAARGDRDAAIAAWQEAILLLPPGSRQADAVMSRLTALRREAAAASGPSSTGGRSWSWIGLGAIAAFVLTKGKLLVLGLTKSTTLLTMLASFGVYWTQWGMWFAAGLVLSIYVHEMGHVAALRRYGIPASAPMFIPGLGALVRMQHMPASAGENARVGLAGPVWGLGAAVAAAAAFHLTGAALWAAVARTGAWINLFNLLPIWQLDGGRAFVAINAPQRWIATLAVGSMWLAAHDGLLLLLLVAVVARAAFDRSAPEDGDWGALATYVGLVIALTYLATTTQYLV